MKNQRRYIIIGGAIIAIGILSYFGYVQFMKRKSGIIDSPVDTKGSEDVLKYGSRGTEVSKLQAWLNDNIPTTLPKLKIDGIFGPKTQEALRKVTGKIFIEPSKIG